MSGNNSYSGTVHRKTCMQIPLDLNIFSDIYIKKTTVLLKCEPSIKQPNFTVVDDNDRAEFVSIISKIRKLY